MSLPREFLLVAAGCRWPLSPDALAAIREAADGAIDWPSVLRILRRHRVEALVYNALQAAHVELPPAISPRLASLAARTVRQNLLSAAETARLQRGFDLAGIPVIVLKGIALAQKAYGSLTLKRSKDIDLLVPPDRVQDSLRLLSNDGYALFRPAAALSDAQRDTFMRYAAEMSLRSAERGQEVELRWRQTDNPFFLDTAWPRTQDIPLSSSLTIRTLADEPLFAYLCVHGASHAWSRLKWLADFNALISEKGDAELERLYRYCEAGGSAAAAGLALLLCHRLLALRLPSSLERRLQSNKRLKLLLRIALGLMTFGRGETEIESRPFGTTPVAVAQVLLADRWRSFLAQCRIVSVRQGDVIQYPLPPGLHFLYPVMRLPLWLWRRVKWAAASMRIDTARPGRMGSD